MKASGIGLSLFSALTTLLMVEQTVTQETSCGLDTFFETSSNICRCNTDIVEAAAVSCANNASGNPDTDLGDEDPIYIAGIFDTTNYEWGEELFEFTMYLIKEGFFDYLGLPSAADSTAIRTIQYDIANADCKETAAARAYWDLRTKNGGRPMHGIVGARCSGASTSLARISGLEEVPQISPSSTSTRLSDNAEFPFFYRLTAPDDARGEVGAIVAMLRWFDWDRVTIISTDTQFAKDLAREFRQLWSGKHNDGSGKWEGKVADYNTIELAFDGSVVEKSVQQVLREVPPIDDPENSRIILLAAQDQHAYHILSIAANMTFQPDTIWVGPSAWTGREPKVPTEGFDWLRQRTRYPGYLGVGPYRNTDMNYLTFLSDLQSWQAWQEKEVWSELPTYGAQMVDSIVAMVSAIHSVPETSRSDGFAVTEKIRKLDFAGVSGRVRFTPNGDLQDPRFSILHLRDTPGGELAWTAVGESGNDAGSGVIQLDQLCFHGVGCNPKKLPDDSYPIPKVKKNTGGVVASTVIFGFLFLVVAVKYWRSRKSKLGIKAELEAFRDSVVGMRTAEHIYIPTTALNVGDNVEQPQGSLTVHTTPKVQWCWQETIGRMDQHDANKIAGDPADCWIMYDKDSNAELEAAFQNTGRQGTFSPMQGYLVDFSRLIQTKTATKYERHVQRLVEDVSQEEEGPKEVDLTEARIGEKLPADIRNEPQMVLVKDDVVQISKQRPDGWAFGTKLYHADEAVARELVSFASKKAPDDDANVFADTGWFQLDATRIPSATDLAGLQKNVGDAGALEPPSHWDPIADPSVVQHKSLKMGDPERATVEKSFMSTLANKRIKIVSVDRVQNLAMWQSYVVKRQTICYRESGLSDGGTTSTADADAIQRKNLERFERRWLWHGTNSDVMDKILQQGFNRSFCGKNATAYGKGVYFARDTSYSSHATYAVPDRSGLQYIMACRVVVGEYCQGHHDVLTPDVRDGRTQSLYDTTVGMLTGDTMASPSIYVTYHDAQAYPEYLIKFKRS